jgi:primosomal protein N' (replication factor Y)
MPKPPFFADVAVPVAARTAFTYLIPESLRGSLQPGHRVPITLGRRKTYGYVVRLHDEPLAERLRALEPPDPEHPLFDSSILELTRWVADYYIAPWGEVLDAALPSIPIGTKRRRRTEPPDGDPPDLESPPALERDQLEIFGRLQTDLHRGAFAVHLLQGVPGSGKTEIYLALATEALEQGGSVLLLEPEIGLATQILDRVRRRFGDRAGLYHSMTGAAQRRRTWERARNGEIRVVVGARSAVFVPLRNLRLVIVDEEQEPAYKQEESPRYHGRDVAIVRARLERALVVLGSATPSLEAWQNVQRGKFKGNNLIRRFAKRAPAKVEIVDLRSDPGLRPSGGLLSPFSGRLVSKIRERLEANQQTILFLNRRGHSTLVQCSDCGEMFTCSRCDVVLTYHRITGDLRCHHCGHVQRRTRDCPSCGAERLYFGGLGTQKLEEKIAEIFPRARTLRLDTDSTRRRGSHGQHIRAIEGGDVDLLIGTQMVAKGFDFPRVTLVGVLQADREMAMPEFRAAERAHQILTQVAGRAGRREIPGEVVIQTMLPEHYVIRAAATGDFESFATEELAHREALGYPPFARMAHLLFDGRREQMVRLRAEDVADNLRAAARKAGVDLLGPAPMFLTKLRNSFRWHLTLKGARSEDLHRLALRALDRVGPRGTRGVRIHVDIDPIRTA